jgi:hypothetical protein
MYSLNKRLYNWPPEIMPPMRNRNCPCRIKYINNFRAGPLCKSNDCVFQGVTIQGLPRCGYRKPIPFPYINYSLNEQRSPYDNQPGC